MTGHTTPEQRLRYYRKHFQTPLKHIPDSRPVPPADVERREFSAPCFWCEARGECRHRRAY